MAQFMNRDEARRSLPPSGRPRAGVARRGLTALGLTFEGSPPDFFDNRRIPEFIRTAKEAFPAQLEKIEERLREG